MSPGRALALACAAAALSSCAAPSFIKEVGGIEYYSGSAGFFSPDGRLPYGGNDAALRREIAEGGGVIFETFTQPGISPGMPPEERVTTLTRIGRSLSYRASEYGGSMAGTVVFSGRGLDKWSYDLVPESGSYLTGTGEVKAGELTAKKKLEQPGRPMLIREKLRRVSREEYSRMLGACCTNPDSAATASFGLRLCAAQLTVSRRECSFRVASTRLQNPRLRDESGLCNRLIEGMKPLPGTE